MKLSLSSTSFMAAFTHFRKDEAEWPKTRPNTKYGGTASRTTQTLDLPMPIHHTRAIVSPSICRTLFAGPRCEQCAMSVHAQAPSSAHLPSLRHPQPDLPAPCTLCLALALPFVVDRCVRVGRLNEELLRLV
jgi:hypothetical protein